MIITHQWVSENKFDTSHLTQQLPNDYFQQFIDCIRDDFWHDYNNALTAVMGNISLAKLEAEDNQELMELLKDAEKAAGRIKNMTERVALFARGIRVNKKTSSAAEIVKRAISTVTGDYPGTLKLDIKDDLPELDLDPELLYEAIICIIENAREAAPSAESIIEINVSSFLR